VVATTTDPSDEPIAEFCEKAGITCFRGDLYDVLDRITRLQFQGAGVVVRLTADCPFIDPEEIDRTITHFHLTCADFTANRCLPPSDAQAP
jgi:spore coat polysaccharide biosynthesis protein SpsF (cytidylyltransferase family)